VRTPGAFAAATPISGERSVYASRASDGGAWNVRTHRGTASRVRYSVVLALSVACFAAAAPARADVSSWLAVGGGVALQRNRVAASNDAAGTVTYSLGVGSSPTASFVLGGLFRGTTMVGLGTDVGLAARGATGGFARGDWGLALELGAAFRTWGDGSYGDWPLQAVLTAGSPLGFQLAIGTEFWNLESGHNTEGAFVALELDILRLTVMRQGSSLRWWPNPSPAGGAAPPGPAQP